MKFLYTTLTAIITGLLVASTALAAPLPKDTGKIDVLKLAEWEVVASNHGGKLLLSDSPETVPADGIMYQDTINGDGRLFFHHVNGTKEQKKIVVLLENVSAKPVKVTVYQHGLSGPGLDYLAVGKAVQEQYLSQPDVYFVEVPAKGSAHLIYQLNDLVVEPEMLVNGMYDFHTDGPVTVKTMMLPAKQDAVKFVGEAKILPADQWRLRGTFNGYDRMLVPRTVYDPLKDGTVAITLADNETDKYLTGIDATDGSAVVNYGNYGVLYRLFLPSVNGGTISYWLNPRGGEYAGAMGLKHNHVPTQLSTPADRLFFGSKTVKDIQKLGNYASGPSMWFTFSPPGASNLPVKIIMSPEK